MWVGATLQAGPQGPGPSFSFAISLLWGEGRGRGISVTLAPHHCLIAGQHLHGLRLQHSTPVHPWEPWPQHTAASLPLIPRKPAATWYWAPQQLCQTLSGCPLGEGAAVGEQLAVLGCHRCWGAGFSPREALQTAPGPRCSGPRAVLDIPTLLPWTPQPPLHWNGPHRHSRDEGQGLSPS